MTAHCARATTLPDGVDCQQNHEFRVTACASLAQRTSSLLPLLPLGPDGVHSLPSQSCRHRPPPKHCMRGCAGEVLSLKKDGRARALQIHHGEAGITPGIAPFARRASAATRRRSKSVPGSAIPAAPGTPGFAVLTNPFGALRRTPAILSNRTNHNIAGSNPARAPLATPADNLASTLQFGGEGGIRTRDTL